MGAFAFAAVAVIALLVGWGGAVMSRRRSIRLRKHAEYANRFFSAVKPLVDDEETPEEVLRPLRFLNGKLTEKRAAKEFFAIISGGRIDVLSRTAPPSFIKAREFFGRRPELEAPFNEAIAAGLLAMTFKNARYGDKVRLWFTALDSQSSRERAAIAYQDLGEKNGTVDGLLAGTA